VALLQNYSQWFTIARIASHKTISGCGGVNAGDANTIGRCHLPGPRVAGGPSSRDA